MDLNPGDLVDHRYVVEKRIGEGGMAEVYRVRHVHLETQHALKVLTVGGKSLQRRLMQEGRVQAAMQHPNIVAVTDVVMVQGSPGLVMEYVTGPPMDDFLRLATPGLDEVDALAVGILDGVAAAHRLDLIHRDLKPANVMLAIVGDHLVPKVADFGLVKLVAEDDAGFASKTRSGTAMGTPAYMPPEQVRDAKTVDHRADIWSLGAILWELVVGERCFDAPDILELMVKVAGNERPHVLDLRPDLPERMANAIEAAMTTEREERVSSVAELKRMWLKGADALPMDPWSTETIKTARSLGSGGEDTGEFLKRSFRSSDQLGKAPGGTAVPFSGTPEMGTGRTAVPATRSDATFAMDDDVGDNVHPTAVPPDLTSTPQEGGAMTIGPEMYSEAAQPGVTIGPEVAFPDGTLEPQAEESLVPVEHEAPARGEPGGRSRTGVVVALAAVGVLGMGGVAAALGGFALMGGGATDAPLVEEVPIDAEGLADAPEEPTEDETTGAAPGTADLPEFTPPPEDPVKSPPSNSEPPPEEPQQGTPEPVPPEEPDQDPDDDQPPPPEPEGTAEAEPVGAVASGALVLDSDVTVFFKDASGNTLKPAQVTSGTYRIIAFFEEGVPTDQGEVVIGEGQKVTVKCLGARQVCRAM